MKNLLLKKSNNNKLVFGNKINLSAKNHEKKKATDNDEEDDEEGGLVETAEIDNGPVILSLIGPLNTETETQIIQTLTILNSLPEDKLKEDDSSKKELVFTICTPGGDAYGMFAIYDLMRNLKTKMTIKTYGVGQIMSAGVLLLSAGTKGHRYIGKNSQVMIHALKGTTHGNTHQLDAEYKQIQDMNRSYNESLSGETNMTAKQVRSIMNKKNDYYINADAAQKLGIVDNIF